MVLPVRMKAAEVGLIENEAVGLELLRGILNPMGDYTAPSVTPT
jgi:hypothetical protein